MASEHDPFSAAAEKSDVTILPKASQGVSEENWAIGAEAAMAPETMCGNFILRTIKKNKKLSRRYTQTRRLVMS